MTFLSIFVFAVLYASVLPSVEPCVLAHRIYVVGLWCVLTGHSFSLNEKGIHALKRCSYNMLALTCLVGAVLISAIYGAMFSSDYIATPVYKTKWTKLEQLENFTLYFGYEKGSGTYQTGIPNTAGLILRKKRDFGLRFDVDISSCVLEKAI